ncbi:MAG: ParB N-terminal domain-containing protein [Deltaproteobacteria bacterium]|nr:ParB N-terminal domain-containing protein [Deltaproteobacteria bacterium]
MTRVQEIPLSAVDFSDHPFHPSLAVVDLAPVMASMEAVGLLNPPWLRAKGDGKWQVVAGLKRLKSAAALGWRAIRAHPLPAETPDSFCLEIALQDNAFSRGFSPWEQAFYARRLKTHWEEEHIVRQFLPLLGLPPSLKVLHRLLAAASLEEEWQPLLAAGRLALTAAARLAEWPPEDRLAALPYFQALPFSQSKQEEFLEWLEVLSRREGVTPAELLSRPELASCLADPSLNPTEKASQVRQCLRVWVFPRLSAAQAAFDQGLSRLGLKQHPRLRLAPPPAFEGPDFILEVRFRDAEELRWLLKDLTRLANQEDFLKLTSL